MELEHPFSSKALFSICYFRPDFFSLLLRLLDFHRKVTIQTSLANFSRIYCEIKALVADSRYFRSFYRRRTLFCFQVKSRNVAVDQPANSSAEIRAAADRMVVLDYFLSPFRQAGL